MAEQPPPAVAATIDTALASRVADALHAAGLDPSRALAVTLNGLALAMWAAFDREEAERAAAAAGDSDGAAEALAIADQLRGQGRAP